MTPSALKLVVLGLGLVAVGLVVAAPRSPAWEGRVFRELRALDGQLIDEPAPALELTTLDGEPFDLAKLRGQVVFLNLWATWCKPCRDELPSMIALARSLESKHATFEMVAVSWDEDPQAVRAFLAEFPELAQRATIVMDPGGERTRGLGTRLLPETYVIDARGRIVARFPSVRDWNSSQSVALMTSLIHDATR